jgi:hypothetical protein
MNDLFCTASISSIVLGRKLPHKLNPHNKEMDPLQSPGRITFDAPLTNDVARLPGFAQTGGSAISAGQDAIRGNLERTPLNQAYFSPENFQIIQNALRYTVYQKTSQIIDPVSTDDLYVVMRSIYYQYCRNLPNNIPQQIDELNKHVVAWCIPKIVAEIDMDRRYIKDITSMPIPLSHPVNMSASGTKSLPFKPFF